MKHHTQDNTPSVVDNTPMRTDRDDMSDRAAAIAAMLAASEAIAKLGWLGVHVGRIKEFDIQGGLARLEHGLRGQKLLPLMELGEILKHVATDMRDL